jgi:glycerophosphoryl diester phosphodiesterase
LWTLAFLLFKTHPNKTARIMIKLDCLVDTGKETLAVLRSCFGQILILHIAYVVLGIIVFGPLTGLIVRLLLQVSGNRVMADMDILFFILSPFGMAALVLFGSVIVTIFAFEQASIITICAGNIQGYKIAPIQVLFATARHAHTLFSFAIHLIARLLLIIAPFLAVAGAIGWFILTDHDINYYLSVKPPAFITAAAIIGCILLVMVVILIHKLISWSLSLPLILFNGTPASASFNQSRQLISGHRIIVLSLFTIWPLITFVLSFLILAGIQFLGSNLITFFYESLSLMVVLLGTLAAILTIANLLITTITAGGFGGLLAVLHRQFHIEISTDIFEALQTSEQQGTKMPSITAALVCSALVSIGIGIWLLQGIQTNDAVEIIAHRGAAGKAPENTMAAIRQAIADDADWVEIDVQETSDGEIIVIHDSDFMKLAGVSQKVWELSLEEIRKIDVGSWFSAQFNNERVPTLKEILEEVRGKARVFIELKYYGHDQQLEQKVVDIVEQAGMIDTIAIMSLKYDGIQKLRSLRPDWNIGLLSATAIGNLTTLDVDFLAVNSAMATASFIKAAHSVGKQILVWTINDRLSMSRYISLGVDGIITDEPELARTVLAERAELSSVERLLLHTAIILDQPLPEKHYRDQSP